LQGQKRGGRCTGCDAGRRYPKFRVGPSPVLQNRAIASPAATASPLDSHAAPPWSRCLLASATTPGRHSAALTSYHSPVSGSCNSIQVGYFDQRATHPKRPAGPALHFSRSRSLSRLGLCLRRRSNRSGVTALFGRYRRRSPSVINSTSRPRSSSSNAFALTGHPTRLRVARLQCHQEG
jgi:hypothetical protein